MWMSTRISGQLITVDGPNTVTLFLLPMGYSVTLQVDGEEVYGADWGGNVSQLLDRAFLGHFRELELMEGAQLEVQVFWGLNNLVGSEPYLAQTYPDSHWKFLSLCTHLFNLWKACKEYPEATLHLSY